MTEQSNPALDCTAHNMEVRREPVKPPPGKDQNSLENGRTTKLYHERFISLESSMTRVVLINFFLLVLYYQFDFANDDGRYNTFVDAVLYLISLCTVLIVPTMVFRARAKLELQFYQKNVFKIQLTPSDICMLFVQAGVLLLQPYPFLNRITFITMDLYDAVPFKFKLNYLLVLLSMFRLYVAFRGHLNRTEYMNPRSNRLSKMYLCKADFQFALKCMFKDYPAELIGSAFLISIALFSFALRVCERQLVKIPEIALNYQFEYMINSVWMTIITMTTVGYGDLFPKTLLGRVVCIMLVVWGIFVVSIMVVVLTNTFQMDQRELKVLSLIKKIERKEDLKLCAVLMIQHVMRGRKLARLKPLTQDSPEVGDYQSKYRQLKKQFRAISNEIKNICEQDDVYEEMARQFHCLDQDLKSLNKNQQKLVDFIHEKMEAAGKPIPSTKHLHKSTKRLF